jgi:hypothetical protein
VSRDGNLGTGMSMGIIFYPWVTSIFDLNQDGYFFSPAGNSTDT